MFNEARRFGNRLCFHIQGRKAIIWWTPWIRPNENRSIQGVHQIRRFPCLRMEALPASETTASLRNILFRYTCPLRFRYTCRCALGTHARCALINKYTYIPKIHDWQSPKKRWCQWLITHRQSHADSWNFLLHFSRTLFHRLLTYCWQTRVPDRNFFMDVSCISKSNTKTWSQKQSEAARLQSVLQTAKCCCMLLWNLPVADRRTGTEVS
jgi:hypothetical protein